jgi:VIT1/CCC1 family predicted Fe2+/Mn2+ transporter
VLHLPPKYLSFADFTGEAAFAVIMVIIINGEVALSNLNSGFLYIVAANLGACLAWGVIDGLIYAFSGSLERNEVRNKLLVLKALAKSTDAVRAVEVELDDTFVGDFTKEGKEAIAKDIVHHVPDASLGEARVFCREDWMGMLSIVGIYLSVGFLLALPFLLLPDKVTAWFVSNGFGVAWLFWYGMRLGRLAGKRGWILGALLASTAVIILTLSYFAFRQ